MESQPDAQLLVETTLRVFWYVHISPDINFTLCIAAVHCDGLLIFYIFTQTNACISKAASIPNMEIRNIFGDN